jgi:hypothetical protein
VNDELNTKSERVAADATQTWCTRYNIPNSTDPGEGGYSKLHFARMWYDLLMASPDILNIVEGEDDPYSWTTGQGCDYSLGGERFSYTGQSESDILSNSSRQVYNIDEGVAIGAADRNMLIGGATPAVGDYNFSNPLREVKVIQSLYSALLVDDIVARVQNCYRPGGSLTITVEDAKNALEIWKEAMEDTWSKGWDDENEGEVQFVCFFGDDVEVSGTTGRMLEEVTVDSTTLTIISIALIAIFSALFLSSFDLIESRILITFVGVALVVLSFLAAVGFGLIMGTKVSQFSRIMPTFAFLLLRSH